MHLGVAGCDAQVPVYLKWSWMRMQIVRAGYDAISGMAL
jgi:hypothetical protein